MSAIDPRMLTHVVSRSFEPAYEANVERFENFRRFWQRTFLKQRFRRWVKDSKPAFTWRQMKVLGRGR